MSTPTMTTREIITDYSASLSSMLTAGDAWPGPLWDALKRISAWSAEYAQSPTVDHQHFVADAASDLRTWMSTPGWFPPDALTAVMRAYEVATWVRRACEPDPSAESVFAAVETARAVSDGVTVEVVRRQDAIDARRAQTQTVLTVLGIHTDRPTMPGAAMLSVAQLRYLSREFADVADRKAAGTRPSGSGRVAAEDDVCGPMSTGQAVA